MEIAFLLARYSVSGVPLAQVRFARALARRGHSVTLIIGFIEDVENLPAFDDLNVIYFGSPKVRSMLWALMRFLYAKKPDVVFSAEDHLNVTVLLAALLVGSKAKISGSSRVTPFDTYSNVAFSKRWILMQLARTVTWRADALTCVSKDMVLQYREVFSDSRHTCIYNIVVDVPSQLRMKESVENEWLVNKKLPIVVAAGRLAPWKNFKDLIEAISIVVNERQVRLIILGDGPLRHDLQALIEARDLCDNVQLLGYVANPLKYFVHSDVFVLSSLVEGLPNVLVEAMMCGCTPVSTDCPTGPREVLVDGKYGYLVPMRDPASMALAILQALEHPISKDLLDEAVAPFEESRIIDQHFEVLGLCEKSST